MVSQAGQGTLGHPGQIHCPGGHFRCCSAHDLGLRSDDERH